MDTKDLRQVFGRFATGITVITTRTPEGEDYGVTINSFAWSRWNLPWFPSRSSAVP